MEDIYDNGLENQFTHAPNIPVKEVSWGGTGVYHTGGYHQEVLPSMFNNIWRWNDIAGVESNHQTMKLYEKLITEEYNEFMEAFTGNAALNFEAEVLEAEELDACIDLIWVIVGYMRSRGWTKETVQEAIEEVERSNYSKFVEGADGTLECIKRSDGKIQKPKEFSPANMLTIIEKFHKNLK